MDILLTNNSNQQLTLISSELIGSSSASELNLPQTIGGGSTAGGYATPASQTPYQAIWSYSPDNGATLLTFECSLAGPDGITIVPSQTGPEANNWVIGESPSLNEGVWVVQFSYSPNE